MRTITIKNATRRDYIAAMSADPEVCARKLIFQYIIRVNVVCTILRVNFTDWRSRIILCSQQSSCVVQTTDNYRSNKCVSRSEQQWRRTIFSCVSPWLARVKCVHGNRNNSRISKDLSATFFFLFFYVFIMFIIPIANRLLVLLLLRMKIYVTTKPRGKNL